MDVRKLLVCVNPGSGDVLAEYVSRTADVSIVTAVNLGGTVEITDSSSGEVNFLLTLKDVYYDKKMYAPGEVLLSFAAEREAGDMPFSKAFSDRFLKTLHYLDVFTISAGADEGSVLQGSDLFFIAQNYYVHGAEIKPMGRDACSLTLKCFSFDKKLTLSPYCKVYTGKRFAGEICTGEVSAILKPVAEDLDALLSKSENSEKRKAELFDFGKGSNRLLMMSYNSEEKMRDASGNDRELRHPYLVQYNESFYDFMVRVAHRCGEFLYFEGGRINLGVPSSTASLLSQNKIYVPELAPKPFCHYPEISLTTGQSVEGFYIDYVNGIPCGADGEYCYDVQNTSDEDLHIVAANDVRCSPVGDWIAYDAVGSFFTSMSGIGALIKALLGAVGSLLNAFLLTPKSVAGDFSDAYVGKDIISEDIGLAIGTDDTANLCNKFYRYVEVNERRSEEGKVCLDFSSYTPTLSLGSVINLNDGVRDNYLVTRMTGTFSTRTDDGLDVRNEISNKVEAVPVFNEKFENELHTVFPVAGDVKHVHKVSQMEAVVTDVDDPLRLGRVRVRYPWQKSDDKSPWIRVSVPYSGTPAGGGFTMTLDVGEHVMLGYVDGNIERPFVSGSLYYRSFGGDGQPCDNMPDTGGISKATAAMYSPKNKVRSIVSGNGHALTFSDTGEKNFFSTTIPFFKSAFSMVKATGVLPQTAQLFGGFGNFKSGALNLKDGTGLCQISLSPDRRTVSINSNFGVVSINAFTGISINAPNGDIAIKGKNIRLEAGNNISILAGQNVERKKKSFASTGGMVLKPLLTKMVSAWLGKVNLDMSKMFDVSLLRSVMEIIVRPVEGTLTVSSNRNVVVTAGMGKVTIPRSLLSDASTWKSVKGKDKKVAFKDLDVNAKNDNEENMKYRYICEDMPLYVKAVKDFTSEYENRVREIGRLARNIKSKVASADSASELSDSGKSGFGTTDKIVDNAKENKEFPSADKFYKTYTERPSETEAWEELKGLYDSLRGLTDGLDSDFKPDKLKSRLKGLSVRIPDVRDKLAPDKICGFSNRPVFDVDFTEMKEKDIWEEEDSVPFGCGRFVRSATKSLWIQAVLALDKLMSITKESGGGFMESPSIGDFDGIVRGGAPEWQAFVKRIKLPSENVDSKKTKFGKAVANVLASYVSLGKYNAAGKFSFDVAGVFNWNGEGGPKAFSNDNANGNILLSHSMGQFTMLSDDSKSWSTFDNVSLNAIKKKLSEIEENNKL